MEALENNTQDSPSSPLKQERPRPRKGLGALRSEGNGAWAVADQMLIAGTNFVTMVCLARTLSPRDFGAFTLIYSVLLFANSFQSGLITQPHNILGATRRGEEYRSFTATTAIAQIVLAWLGGVLALAGGLVGYAVGWSEAALLVALAPAIVAWQLQEFVRRVLYTEGSLRSAFVNDLICWGPQTVIIAALWWMGTLTGVLALNALTATTVLAAGVGAWRIRHSLRGKLNWAYVRENWHFGKWLAGGEVVGYWLSAQTFVYLAAAMLGAAAAGVLRAVHTLFGPARILAYVFSTVLPIRLAKTLANEGKKAAHSQLKQAIVSGLPLIVGYPLLVAVLAKPLLWLLYGEKYAGYASVLVLYSVAMALNQLTMILAAALRAKRLTRYIFMSRLLSSVASIPMGWLVIHFMGVDGAAVAMILYFVGLSVLFWRAYERDLGQASDSSGPSAGAAEEVDRGAMEPSPAPGEMLLRVFHVLDRAGVRCCILHGYEDYLQAVRSDVDCVMSRSDLRRLGRVLNEHRDEIGGRIVQWMTGEEPYIILAGVSEGGPPVFLHLHISTGCTLRHRVFYTAEEVLEGRRVCRGFWVPAAHVEFGSTLVRRIIKGRLDERHAAALTRLFEEAPERCCEEIARFWGWQEAEWVALAARSGEWGSVRLRLTKLRNGLLRRTALRRPVQVAWGWLRGQMHRAGRWIRPNGASVVLLGPDGAGKSSIAEGVRRDLGWAFARSQGRTFPPALLQRGPKGTRSTPHAERPRSYIQSVVRAIGYWFVYCTIGHYFTIRPAVARATLVLHDRHFLDALVDTKRYRYGGPVWLLRVMWWFIPKPDLVIALDGPAEVINARKREVPLEETARQLMAYRGLVGPMRNGRVVDVSQPIAKVVGDVNRSILQFLAGRVARRCGWEVEA